MKHLKKLSFAVLLSLFLANGATAQEAETKEKVKKELSEEKQYNRSFDRWSIEVNGGLNALVPIGKTIVNHGINGKYSTSRISPFHVDLGARFMINRYVGIKANIGYDQVSPGFDKIGLGKGTKRDLSKVNDFKGHYYGVDVQAVVNLGQILNFPEFSSRLGLLTHAGVGYRAFRLNKDIAPETYVDGIKRDNIVTFTWGITPMLRLHDRVVLTADFSQVFMGKQQTQLDGSRGDHGAIDAVLHTYTLGLTFNLGKDKKHIDFANKKVLTQDIVDKLKEDLAKEQEENSKAIDGLKDKVDEISKSMNKYATEKDLDALRDELNKIINDKLKNAPTQEEKEDALLNFIDRRVLAAYFDFDVRTPQTSSLENIKHLGEFMQKNANTKVKLVGYADAVGTVAYNQKLGQDRANNVKDILVKQYGIEASRIEAISGGVDDSADVHDDIARNSVRRVTFNLSKK